MAHPTGFEPVTFASSERPFEMFQFDVKRQKPYKYRNYSKLQLTGQMPNITT